MRIFLGLVLFAIAVLPASAEGWYSGVYGGWNSADVISSPIVSTDEGFAIGGVVGRKIHSVPGLRIEADMSFRQAEVDIFGKINADHSTFALLANAAYDFPVSVGPFHPYVLAGAGYGHSEATFENVSLLKLESSGFAWQLGAGLNTQVAENVTMGIGYRYLRAPDITVLGTELSDGSNHSVLATVNFAF